MLQWRAAEAAVQVATLVVEGQEADVHLLALVVRLPGTEGVL